VRRSAVIGCLPLGIVYRDRLFARAGEVIETP
jgi:hypothetical protein